MGLFSSKKTTPTVAQVLSLKDKDLDALLKKHGGGKTKAYKTAKEFRKVYGKNGVPEDGHRRHLDAFLRELKQDGASNWANQPVSSRVHPSMHRRQLLAEVQQAIRSGDTAAQWRLRAEAQKHGYI